MEVLFQMPISTGSEITDDWWPSALSEFSKEKPLAGDHVVVAEISQPWGEYSAKLLSAGLAPNSMMSRLAGHRNCIGHKVSTSGPWPSSYRGQFNYTPAFWIEGVEPKDQLEPLVISWESAGKTILIPDQGFLMTYGLMPRQCGAGELIWDDPQNGVFDVVKVEPPSEFFYELLSKSRVLIRRDYLQDYATLRNMNIIQTYFVENSSDRPDDVSEQLLSKQEGEHFFPQRKLLIRPDHRGNDLILAQVWGYRNLFKPQNAPVSDDSDYGELYWPGPGTVDEYTGTSLQGLPQAHTCVYVHDSVLGEYEGRPGFDISPETGSVSYLGQWCVPSRSRIGRDLLQVDLKTLYEGNSPRTVKTWHKYSTDPPAIEDLDMLRDEANIATRARTLVYAMADLGEVLANIVSKITGTSRTGQDLVNLNRTELDYRGWWNNAVIEPITRHAPTNMKECEFMERCVDLYKVAVEGLSESLLRKTLTEMGIGKQEIESHKSLKLLERLVKLALVADETGLDFLAQGPEIERRRNEITSESEEGIHTPVSVLFNLRDLRVSKSHSESDAEQALKDLGICAQKMVPGWGNALDMLYDRTAQALVDIRKALQAGLGS